MIADAIPTSEAPAVAPARRDAATMTQRFVALAFCRADILFELDSSQRIIFSAGTTP